MEEISRQPIEIEHIEALESGQASISGRLVHIAIACSVRPEWLILSEGPMIKGGQESELQKPPLPISTLAEELVDNFMLLPLEHQQHLLEIVKQMALPMNPDYQAYEAEARRQIGLRDSEK